MEEEAAQPAELVLMKLGKCNAIGVNGLLKVGREKATVVCWKGLLFIEGVKRQHHRNDFVFESCSLKGRQIS